MHHAYLAAEPWLPAIREAIPDAIEYVRTERARRGMSTVEISSQPHTDLQLRPRLIAAIVAKESGGDQLAGNAEPHYQYLWHVRGNRPFRELTPSEIRSEIPPEDFTAHRGVPTDFEWWHQQIGIGLMQVQGAVARERGYEDRWLSALYTGEISIRYGSRHLAWLLAWAQDEDAAIASYNGGPQRGPQFRNPEYLEAVRALEQELPLGLDP